MLLIDFKKGEKIDNKEEFLESISHAYNNYELNLFDIPIESLTKKQLISICKMQHYHMVKMSMVLETISNIDRQKNKDNILH